MLSLLLTAPSGSLIGLYSGTGPAAAGNTARTRATAQSVAGDLNDKIASLSEDRNVLERELVKLQSQMQLEKTAIANVKLCGDRNEGTSSLTVKLRWEKLR